MPTTALVISGGSAKGAFAVGVLKFLFKNRPEIDFDIICGTSTGSLIAPLAATREIDILEHIYTHTETKDIILRGDIGERFLSHASLFDVSPLVSLVKNTYGPRFNSIMATGKNLFFATVCLQTGKIVYFSTRSDDSVNEEFEVIKLHNQDEMMRAIVASSDQPVFMPAIEFRPGSIPIRQYVDGGVREYAPMRIAIENGAANILAIILSPNGVKQQEEAFDNVPQILMRSIGLFSEDVGANDVVIPKLYSEANVYLNNLQRQVAQKTGLSSAEVTQLFNGIQGNPFAGKPILNIKMIRPRVPLPSDGLEFDPGAMTEMVNIGFSVAQEEFQNAVFA